MVCNQVIRTVIMFSILWHSRRNGDEPAWASSTRESYTKNRKRLSVPCYFLAPCDKRKPNAHAHQQVASQASADSVWRHHVWLPHSNLGFKRPEGRRSYRVTPQVTIAQSAIVACFYYGVKNDSTALKSRLINRICMYDSLKYYMLI